MATMSIELEVPNTMAWTKEQLVSAIKAFVTVFTAAAPKPVNVQASESELPISDFVRNLGLPTGLPAAYDAKEEYRKHLDSKYS